MNGFDFAINTTQVAGKVQTMATENPAAYQDMMGMDALKHVEVVAIVETPLGTEVIVPVQNVGVNMESGDITITCAEAKIPPVLARFLAITGVSIFTGGFCVGLLVEQLAR